MSHRKESCKLKLRQGTLFFCMIGLRSNRREDMLLDVKNVKKTYSTRLGGKAVEALKDVTFSVEEGEYVAIMGESGSGKTTLLNILALLDNPTEGQVVLKGKDLGKLKDKDVAAFRRTYLGYVFQEFQLLDTLSVKDNILLPLVLAGVDPKLIENGLPEVVNTLGISDLLEKYPFEISGGEQQRTAIARALITNPELILADEPTGALDSKNTEELLNLFDEINEMGQTILMVTHSVKAASHAKRVLFIKDGKIYHQLYRGERSSLQMFEEISKALTMLTRGGEVS